MKKDAGMKLPPEVLERLSTGMSGPAEAPPPVELKLTGVARFLDGIRRRVAETGETPIDVANRAVIRRFAEKARAKNMEQSAFSDAVKTAALRVAISSISEGG